MKNLINKKNIFVVGLTLCSLSFVHASESKATPFSNTFKVSKSKNKKDCVDCFATIPTKGTSSNKIENKNLKKEKVYEYDDSKASSSNYVKDTNGYDYQVSDADAYKEHTSGVKKKSKVILYEDNIASTPKSKVYSNEIAIQVGAFRRYAGAKVYAKKYALLSSRYKVEIQAGAKDNKPLYRVRIEGFSSKRKAREFKRKYSLTGAFLVLK